MHRAPIRASGPLLRLSHEVSGDQLLECCCRCSADGSGKPFLKKLGEWGARLFGGVRQQPEQPQKEQGALQAPAERESSAAASPSATAPAGSTAEVMCPSQAPAELDAEKVHRQMREVVQPTDDNAVDLPGLWCQQEVQVPDAPSAGSEASWEEWQQVTTASYCGSGQHCFKQL